MFYLTIIVSLLFYSQINFPMETNKLLSTKTIKKYEKPIGKSILDLINPDKTTETVFEDKINTFLKTDFDSLHYMQTKSIQLLYLTTFEKLRDTCYIKDANHFIYEKTFAPSAVDILERTISFAEEQNAVAFPFLLQQTALGTNIKTRCLSFQELRNQSPFYYHAYITFGFFLTEPQKICSEFNNFFLESSFFDQNSFVSSDDFTRLLQFSLDDYETLLKKHKHKIIFLLYKNHIKRFMTLSYERFKKDHYLFASELKQEIEYALSILTDTIHIDPINLYYLESRHQNIARLLIERDIQVHGPQLLAKIQKQMTASTCKKKKKVKKNKKGKLLSAAPDSENNNCT